ncbi:hypothetical protein IFR10_25635 [Bacillus sp. CFBP 13597]|nr:hypothetical protein [Bacillus sp. CFBP 13597]
MGESFDSKRSKALSSILETTINRPRFDIIGDDLLNRSIIVDKYSFPPARWNSVTSVTHFSLDFATLKSRARMLVATLPIFPLYERYLFM